MFSSTSWYLERENSLIQPKITLFLFCSASDTSLTPAVTSDKYQLGTFPSPLLVRQPPTGSREVISTLCGAFPAWAAPRGRHSPRTQPLRSWTHTGAAGPLKGKSSAPGMLLKGASVAGGAGEELNAPPGTSIGWQRAI